MRIKHPYFCAGAFAVIAAALLIADQSMRDAYAQQSANETQTESLESVNPNEPTQPTNQANQSYQRQTRSPRDAQAESTDPSKRSWRASEVIGMNVRGKTGDDAIGEISDAMIGPDGKIVYVAVSFGGFLGLGEKLFAVPWEAVQFVREGEDRDDVYARIDVTEQQLQAKRGFNTDRWPREADESFLPGGSRPPRHVERPTPSTSDQNVPR